MTGSEIDQMTATRRFTAALAAAIIATTITGAIADEKLPTGEQVMDNFVKSIGGKSTLLRIKNTVTKGKITVAAMGQAMPFIQYAAAPNNLVVEIETGMAGTMVQGTDGDLAWGGGQLLDGAQRDSLRTEAVFNAQLNWRKIYEEVKCVELTEFNKVPCYKLLQKPKHGTEIAAYFEKGTWLKRGVEKDIDSGVGPATEVQVIQGYREIGGILYAHKVTRKVTMGGMTQEMIITRESIEQNVDLPKDRFAPPESVVKQAEDAASKEKQENK